MTYAHSYLHSHVPSGMKMMELEQQYPDADFVFKLPDDVKQAWLAERAKRKKQ